MPWVPASAGTTMGQAYASINPHRSATSVSSAWLPAPSFYIGKLPAFPAAAR